MVGIKEYDGPTEFVHLHTHTIFSPLDGVARPKQYMEACRERDWPAVAITEHGTMSSIPDAYWSAKENDVKFIAGCEIYYNDYELWRQKLITGGKKLKDVQKHEGLFSRVKRNRHLTVLCKNETGYRNLLRLNLFAWKNGFYYKPRIWFNQLAKHREGLIILSGCLNGPLAHELRISNYRKSDGIIGAYDYLEMFNKAFGDDYYIEIQMPCIREPGFDDLKVFKKLVTVAKAMNKKLVLTNDSHYMSREDFEVQKTMMAIDQGLTVDSPDLFHVNSSEQFFKTRAELRKTFYEEGYSDSVDHSVFEESCDNTLEVADKCDNFEFDTCPKLPLIENSGGKLSELSYHGLKMRGIDNSEEYEVDGKTVTARDQLEIELERIIEKGFSSYFLITKQIADFARETYGPDGVGPARGSAGGSLICYLLGITDINPLKWKLSFSRMLSPARGGEMLKVSME